MKQILETLNQKQYEAVTATLGPCLVIAGAGSGKTRVLTLRCLYLVNELNFDPSRVLCISFTNKAANEMKHRLEKMSKDVSFKWITTFHGLCLRILREDINLLGYDKNFNILDEEDQIAILKEAYKLFEVDVKTYPYRLLLNFIEKCKSNEFSEQDINNDQNWKKLFIKSESECQLKINVLNHYLKVCKDSNSLDFNDLLIFANKLLSSNQQAYEKWRNKFDYILVDEFQDTNDQQYDLVKYLCSNNNLFVVGDPDQMIYSWRGANQYIINNFAKLHENCKVIIMDRNYRSIQPILNVANNLICQNINRYQKDLYTDKLSDEKPKYFNAESQDDESRWVVSNIINLIQEQKVQPNEICILYRSNFLSRNIEQELMINNISYVIYGGIKFYQRKEIKDVLAYLKTIFLMDEISIKRIINVPKRGVSLAAIDEITKYAYEKNMNFVNALFEIENINVSSIAKKGINEFISLLKSIDTSDSLSMILNQILFKTKYVDYLKSINEFERVRNIEELEKSIYEYEQKNPNNNFIDYLQEISIFYDHEEDKKDSISLMTVHTSKGLEFKYVFIIGLNEGIFPSWKNLDTQENLDEERRIAYVAITRAKDKLFLSSFGGYDFIHNNPNKPSRFIKEIDLSLLSTDSVKIKSISKSNDGWFDSSKKKNYREQYNENKEEFRMGDHVIHTIFGEGIVLKVNGDILDVSFKHPYNKKTIVANHNSLKRKITIN